MAFAELHRALFVEFPSSACAALAATPCGGSVAVGREDGSVELYDAADWRCVLRAPGCEGASLTSLVWVERDGAPPSLLSAGLTGQLLLWGLAHLRPLSATDSGGGPCVAVACDDGCVRLFGAPSAGGLELRRALPRVAGRALSVCWHPSRVAVVVGSSDGCVRVWDARSGGELLRLTLPPLGGAPCCVWAVLCLPDGTLVSGDAAGRTCVWEGRHGGLLHAFALHAADVLCLAATPQGDKLFAAGVDAHVQLLARTAGGGWAAAASKRPHARDIRALCLLAPAATGAALLSAGADGAVVAHAADGFAREHGVRVVRAQPQPQPCAAAAAPLLLVTHPQRLDVWRLGAARAPPPGAPVRPPGGSCSLELACAPRCLLSIAVRCDRHLLCGALSADGTRAAASDALRPRLYALALAPGGGPGGGPRAGGPASRARRLPLCASLPCALFAAFTPAWLVLGSPAGAVHLVDPTRGGAPVRAFKPHHTACGPRPAPQPTAVAVPPLSGLAASWDGEWVAVSVWCPGGGLTSTARGSCVVLLSLDAHRRAAALPLPQEEGGGGGGAAACCALAWAPHGHGAALLALTAAKRVLLCDTATGLAPAWAEAQQGAGAALSRRASAMPGHPLSLSCDPERGLCAVLLHTQLALCHVDATRPTSEAGVGGGAGAQPPKRRRDPGGADAQPAGPANGRVLALANPCLLAAYVRPGTVLLVEQPPQAQQDAGALLRHTFGK